jgi:hypothetical protein
MLALLRDASRIAEWDSVSAPPPSGVVRPGWDGNTGGGARTEATDRPDFLNAMHRRLDHGAHLRDRLDALMARGKRETALMQVFYSLQCVLAFEHRLPWPVAPPAASDLEKGAAVIEWLVRHAKVISESANQKHARPLDRALPKLVALAFSTPEQRVKWEPAVPVPPIPPIEPTAPERPVKPEPPAPICEDASEPERREHHADCLQYQNAMASYHARLREYLVKFSELAHACARYTVDMKRHRGLVHKYETAVKLHPKALLAGAGARNRYGRELLDLAERVWGMR